MNFTKRKTILEAEKEEWLDKKDEFTNNIRR